MIIPGVNDGEVLRQTCNDLEEWGAKGFILMRFANTFNEGLILGNEPILKGYESQPIEEFAQLVKDINKEYSFRVTGTPLCDPETGGPFAIAKKENEIFLQYSLSLIIFRSHYFIQNPHFSAIVHPTRHFQKYTNCTKLQKMALNLKLLLTYAKYSYIIFITLICAR